MPNVLELLKEFRKSKGARAKEPLSDDLPATEQLTLDEFAESDLVLTVKSKLLGEEIVFASNPECLLDWNGPQVVYLPQELKILSRLTPDAIKRIHALKKLVDGDIIGSTH
jgi:hypothetical protein